VVECAVGGCMGVLARIRWDGVPDSAFMVRSLRGEFDGVVRGTVTYMNEFSVALAERSDG
jgi:hypothetical protein